MPFVEEIYDIAVVGAGHAGCEAALAAARLGFETIIVNCNPETVSTDYDTSDKLYFEPLTLEDVLSIYKKEKPVGVIAQFGGHEMAAGLTVNAKDIDNFVNKFNYYD